MNAEARAANPARMGTQLCNVGSMWIECEIALNTLCDQLDGESTIYLAIDTLYPVLPKYRLTNSALLGVTKRLQSLAAEVDEPQLRALIEAGAYAAQDYYRNLPHLERSQFPLMRFGYLVNN